MNLKESLKRLFGGKRPSDGGRAKPLPMLTVTHDTVDTLRWKLNSGRVPRLNRILHDAPVVTPDSIEPEPIDFTEATPEEIIEWQASVKKARDAREKGKPYEHWEALLEDLWNVYHHSKPPEVLEPGQYSPLAQLHARLMTKLLVAPETLKTREVTRDDAPMSAAAVIHGAGKYLKPLLEEDLAEQVQQATEAQDQVDKATRAENQLVDLRQEAAEFVQNGEPLPPELRDRIKALVQMKRDALDKAEEVMSVEIPMNQEAHDRIRHIAKATHEAVKEMANAPHFGQHSFGEDEPVYESPEQALAIAERWSRDPLRGIAQRYGRLDPNMRQERAQRVVGGKEEIVDVEFGDDLSRLTPTEMARLAMDDEDYFDDFVMRYMTQDLLVFQTVGEDNAGQGSVVMVLDESSSTKGDRNMFSKATTMAVLNMCRREKRDMAVVAFSGGSQVESWVFPAKEPLDAERILDMAAHHFNGGTTPLPGLRKAADLLHTLKQFKTADIVLVTDGETSYGAGDKALRSRLIAEGVRLHGIGIGGTWGYLKEWVSDKRYLVHVMDFELGDPNAATTALATHIT